MEKYAFSRAAYYVSINYPVSPLEITKSCNIFIPPRKMLQKALVLVGCWHRDRHLSLNSSISGFSTECLIEIGWHYHHVQKRFGNYFDAKKDAGRKFRHWHQRKNPFLFPLERLKNLVAFLESLRIHTFSPTSPQCSYPSILGSHQ